MSFDLVKLSFTRTVTNNTSLQDFPHANYPSTVMCSPRNSDLKHFPTYCEDTRKSKKKKINTHKVNVPT